MLYVGSWQQRSTINVDEEALMLTRLLDKYSFVYYPPINITAFFSLATNSRSAKLVQSMRIQIRGRPEVNTEGDVKGLQSTFRRFNS
jgi:hypothetical protein